MEQKKLKKLVLKKNIILQIENGTMNLLHGGYQGAETCWCLTGTKSVTANFSKNGDCSNHSAAGSGCDAETCGDAWTCNGR